jgi:hypothetical protein
MAIYNQILYNLNCTGYGFLGKHLIYHRVVWENLRRDIVQNIDANIRLTDAYLRDG